MPPDLQVEGSCEHFERANDYISQKSGYLGDRVLNEFKLLLASKKDTIYLWTCLRFFQSSIITCNRFKFLNHNLSISNCVPSKATPTKHRVKTWEWWEPIKIVFPQKKTCSIHSHGFARPSPGSRNKTPWSFHQVVQSHAFPRTLRADPRFRKHQVWKTPGGWGMLPKRSIYTTRWVTYGYLVSTGITGK